MYIHYIMFKALVDVINVSGHRLSTAEIESALILHPSCAEAAVVGIHDELTGYDCGFEGLDQGIISSVFFRIVSRQAIVCFCTLKSEPSDLSTLSAALIAQVRMHIGPFATPKRIVITPDLPKTRSGKIMRRILRKVAGGEVSEADLNDESSMRAKLGDLTTLADPAVVAVLIKRVAAH